MQVSLLRDKKLIHNLACSKICINSIKAANNEDVIILEGEKMLKTKKILQGLGNAFMILLVLLVVFIGFSTLQTRKNPHHIPSIMGYRSMTVLSGSMRPMLEPGDMIITKSPKVEDIQVGDVITYRVGNKNLVTHRVVDVLKEEEQIRFQTQGDANNAIDLGLVYPEDIVGSYLFRIPKGGYIANFIKSPKGFVLFVLLPIILLIMNELKIILLEIEKNKKDKISF